MTPVTALQKQHLKERNEEFTWKQLQNSHVKKGKKIYVYTVSIAISDYRSWSCRRSAFLCTESNREVSFGDSSSCSVLKTNRFTIRNKHDLVPALPRPVRVHWGLQGKVYPATASGKTQNHEASTVHAFVQQRVTVLLWFDFLTLFETLFLRPAFDVEDFKLFHDGGFSQSELRLPHDCSVYVLVS